MIFNDKVTDIRLHILLNQTF